MMISYVELRPILVLAVCIVLSTLSVTMGADRPETLAPAGGGAYPPSRADSMTEEQRDAIWRRLQRNRATLVVQGKVSPVPAGAPPQLIFPLRMANGLNVNEYYGISGYVDQNPACPGSLLDYNCGQRTYDTSACYNHGGIDYFLWPFAFLWMDKDQVEIVAAAPGTILGKDDGFFDRSCDWVSNPNWNAVYVEHADGSIAWYGHMKNGSTTTKGIGEPVAAGEYLGVVGSSGVSTFPHLHFELHDSFFNLQEPHYIPGQCNTMNNFSWWLSQPPYRDSKVSLLTIGGAAPFVNACPSTVSGREDR